MLVYCRLFDIKHVVLNSTVVFNQYGNDWSSSVKKWQQFVEIQDGGGSHLEKYSSDWITILRYKFPELDFESEIYCCVGDILTFDGLVGSIVKRLTMQIGSLVLNGLQNYTWEVLMSDWVILTVIPSRPSFWTSNLCLQRRHITMSKYKKKNKNNFIILSFPENMGI